MPLCPPLSCPARICPFRAHCPSSSGCFLTIRLALLTLKPSAGATGSSADGAAQPANPTASPTGRRFCGAAKHRRQRRQKIADDCPRFLALKALGDNLIDLRLINLIDEGLAEVFYKTRRIFVPAGDS